MADSSVTPPQQPGSLVGRAQLIGSVVGYLLLAVTLALIFGPHTEPEWWMPTFLAGSVVGGTIGGIVQMRREQRSAEAGKFLGQQLFNLLPVAAIFAGALVGHRYYGDAGWWAGLLGVSGLGIAGAMLFGRGGQPGGAP